MNNKAQLGLNTVKLVMIAFLVLSVLAVTILLVLPELRDVVETVDFNTGFLANVTTIAIVNGTTSSGVGWAAVTDADGNVHQASKDLINCKLTITIAYNATAAEPDPFIPATNYSILNCNVVGDAGVDPMFDDQLWNLTGSYTYSNTDSRELVGNVSTGIRDFFDNTSTIFAILVVVVIILAIAIIIAVVSRFGGGGGGASQTVGTGGGSKFGSDTVMGV